MTVGDRDELLSAYLDREVTPDERAEVEARLDASPDSRAELDALAELSLCLRTLDLPQAPADFQASVMQALAGRKIASDVTPATSPRRKAHREWMVSIIAVATTACALLVAVTNWNSPSPVASDNKAVLTEDRSVAVDGLALTPASMDGASTLRESVTGSGGIARFSKTDGLFNEEKLNFPMPGAADLKPASAPAPAAEMRDAEYLHAADQPVASREIKETAGKSIDKVALLNQVLENWAATDSADQYVANIDLQVLDVRQTADSFQFILHNNGVVTLAAQDMTTAKKTDDEVKSKILSSVAKNGTVTASGDLSLIAVYVDTTTDRVTKSLEELAQQKRVLDVNQGPYLPFSRLAEEGDVTLAKERAESLQRADVEDLTRLYVTQQWGDLSDSEMDLPVDALDVYRESGNAKSERYALNRARQFANPKMVAKAVPAAPVDAARTKDSTDNTTGINNTLNYSSKLQLESVPSTPLSDLTEALNTEGAVAKGLNTRADAIQAGNTQRRANALRQNNDYGTNALANGRQRTLYQNSANPVRVLVVFQDPAGEVKAKNSQP